MKRLYVTFFFLIATAKFVFAQTNPTAQTIPYTQSFGGSQFNTLPSGWAAWNGLSGASVTTQSSAEGSAPIGDATVTAATATQSAAGVYGLAISSNARLYVQQSSNTTNGVNQPVLALNTTGKTNITISFNYTAEVSVATRALGVVLQYRVGISGGWTTLSVGVQNNPYNQTTSTTAGTVTAASADLPAACENQSVVQLRWANWRPTGTGNSQGFSIDDISVTSTAPTPTIVLSPGSPTLNFGSIATGNSSTGQSFQVSGTNLTNDIVLGALTHYEYSTTSATAGFLGTNTALTLTQSGGTVSATTVWVRFSPSATGALNATLNVTSTGATTKTAALTGTGTGPTITLSQASFNFGNWECDYPVGVAQEQSYTVSGSNLTDANLVITAPSPFVISNTSGSGFGSTLSLPVISGSVAATTVYVRFAPTGCISPPNTYTNVTLSHVAAPATTQNLLLSGTALAPLSPIIVSNLSLPNFGTWNNGQTSAEQSYQVSSNYLLSGSVTINAPDYFRISKVSGGPYTDTLMWSPSQLHNGTNSTPRTVYVVFRPSSGTNGSINGSIQHTAPSIGTRSLSVAGTEAGNIVITPITTIRNAVDANCVTIYNNTSPWTQNTSPTFNLRGQVYGLNGRTWGSSGISRMTLIDATAGIYIDYSGSSTFGLSSAMVEGDSVTITGYISNITSGGNPVGRTIIVPASITRINQGNPLKTPSTVTVLNEATEADYIRLTGVTITTAITWSNTIAANTSLAATAGGNTINIFIPTGSSLVGQTYASVFNSTSSNLTLLGLGNQFKTGAGSKCSGGYELLLYSVAGVIPDPNPRVNVPPPTSLSFGSWPAGSPSSVQNITVSGSNLTPGGSAQLTLNVTGPFEIFNTGTSSWVTSWNITSDGVGNVTNQQVQVRYQPTGVGAQSGSIAVNGTTSGTNTVTVPLDGVAIVAGTPVLSASPASLNFGSLATGSTSGEKSFSLNISNNTNIDQNVVLTSVANFQISLTSGTGYTNSITLNSPVTASQTVYVIYQPTGLQGQQGGNLTITGTATGYTITSINVLLQGYNGGNTTTYQYLRGTLHTHTSFSDGNKDAASSGCSGPACSYAYAVGSKFMDFLGIAEHNHAAAGQTPGEWTQSRQAAASWNAILGTGANTSSANPTGTVALYGMEYGVISNGGHVAIYGSPNLIGWDNLNTSDVFVAKSNYINDNSGLFNTVYQKLQTGGPTWTKAFATLCHPNQTDYNNLFANTRQSSGLTFAADSVITGCAMRSGPAFSTNNTYSEPSASTYLTQYNRGLAAGYHFGPTIDHDTHNTVFGRSQRGRTHVLAASKDTTSILDALQQNRFYAADDWNVQLDFNINGRVMGQSFAAAGTPNISITMTDVNNAGDTEGGQVAGAETATSIQILAGVPGSGSSPTAIQTFSNVASGSTVSFTDNSLPNLTENYYYVVITQADGDLVWSSPIWYKRNDALGPLPVVFLQFTGTYQNNAVLLRWATASELNNDRFEIERSAGNPNNFVKVGVQLGNGTTTQMSRYSYPDVDLIAGVNTYYYRLKQVDYDGTFAYSPVVQVEVGGQRSERVKNWSLYPNPFSGEALQIVSTNPDLRLSDRLAYRVSNTSGAVLIEGIGTLAEINEKVIAGLIKAAPGAYFITLGNNESIRVIRQ